MRSRPWGVRARACVLWCGFLYPVWSATLIRPPSRFALRPQVSKNTAFDAWLTAAVARTVSGSGAGGAVATPTASGGVSAHQQLRDAEAERERGRKQGVQDALSYLAATVGDGESGHMEYLVGWDELFRLNQTHLEAAVRRVSSDDSLAPQRKAYLIQNLMTCRWIAAQQRTGAERAKAAAAAAGAVAGAGPEAPGAEAAGAQEVEGVEAEAEAEAVAEAREEGGGNRRRSKKQRSAKTTEDGAGGAAGDGRRGGQAMDTDTVSGSGAGESDADIVGGGAEAAVVAPAGGAAARSTAAAEPSAAAAAAAAGAAAAAADARPRPEASDNADDASRGRASGSEGGAATSSAAAEPSGSDLAAAAAATAAGAAGAAAGNGSGSGAPGGPSAPQLMFHAPGVLGCQHYARNCALVAPCCNQRVGCRLCHDAQAGHVLDRYSVCQVDCMLCGDAGQPAAERCRTCHEKFARYFCSVCKFYDDAPGARSTHRERERRMRLITRDFLLAHKHGDVVVRLQIHVVIAPAACGVGRVLTLQLRNPSPSPPLPPPSPSPSPPRPAHLPLPVLQPVPAGQGPRNRLLPLRAVQRVHGAGARGHSRVPGQAAGGAVPDLPRRHVHGDDACAGAALRTLHAHGVLPAVHAQ